MLAFLTLLAALLFNHFVAPPAYTAAGPFALAVVIAARRHRPHGTLALSIASGFLYVAAALLSDQPPAVWLGNLVALAIVGYLGYVLSGQRQSATVLHRGIVASHRQLVQFLGIVAHDMRQPLTAIDGYTQLLSRSEGRSETERRALASLDDATRRLRRLTDDLADASTVGAGRFALRPQPLDLVALLRQVAEEHQAEAPGHALALDGPERLLGVWDADRLSQLFGNLVANAVKYSPQGGAVRITVYHEDDEVVVCVSDHGLGIARDQQALLFQPFSRLHAEAAPGTGLGLFISQGIAEAHGGRITVESEVGEGSTFRVALPLVSASAVAPRRTRRPRHPEAIRSPRRTLRESAEPGTLPDGPAASLASAPGRRDDPVGRVVASSS